MFNVANVCNTHKHALQTMASRKIVTNFKHAHVCVFDSMLVLEKKEKKNMKTEKINRGQKSAKLRYVTIHRRI